MGNGFLCILLGLAPGLALSSRASTNGLALTPPMGWNSWNYFGCNVSDSIIRNMADVMASNGMRAAGYQFINMDDCWQVSRDDNGVIVADPVRFPDGIAALADYVHSKGLKLGVYSDHGLNTCGGRPGGYGFEYLDALTYASWGVDYLKYDNCNLPSGDVAAADYARMADALMSSGRPITFSICAWSFVSWMPGCGNLWRTTGDINDSFASMLSNLAGNSPPAFLAGPGRWNDPDMLEVGNGGMSFTEDQAHFSLWCLVSAPLILGNNLTNMSAQTLSILTNAALIAVDQDPAGEQAVRLPNTSTNQIWVKPLGFDFNTKAVALFNPNTNAATITVNWTDLGLLAGRAVVWDLWAGADLGPFTNSFTTNVPAEGVVVLKVGGTPPLLPGAGTNYLTDLQPAYGYVGWGAMTNDRSIGGHTLTLNGTNYAKGLGVHAFSGVEFRLGGIASRFQSDIGVDDEVGANGSVVFHVLADGTEIFNSGVLTGGAPHQSVNLDVTGVNRLTLGVSDADNGNSYDHADWAGALVVVSNTVPAPPPAPTGLSASPGMPILLAWDAARSAVNYNIKRGPSPGGAFTNLASSVLPGFADTNVESGVTYFYVVSALGDFGESSNSTSAGALACAPPPAPSGVTAVAGNQQVTLFWNPVPGATGYNLARALSSTPFSYLATGLAATNYLDLAVVNGSNYSYVVFASNSCALSSASAYVNATPMQLPPAPTGLTAITAGSSAVLQWNAVSNAASYNLGRSTSAAGPFLPVATNLTALFQLDTGLLAGTTYYYVVSAVNSAGESPDSAEAVAVPCSGGLPAGWSDQDIGPVGLAGAASCCGSSFVMQGGGADIWNTADAFHFAGAPLAGDSSIVTRVDEVQNTSSWAKGGVMFRNDNTAGSMFVDMIVSAASGASLQWRSAAGGSCSSINVAGVAAPAWVMLTRSSNTFTGYYSSDGATWIAAGSATVALSGTALAGLAVTAHNNSALCLAAFDAASTAPPATPTGLNPAANYRQVTVTWNPATGAVSYDLQRALAGAGPYTNVASLAAAGFTDTNVANGTAYYYQVSAVNPLGPSPWSAPAAAALPLPALAAVSVNTNVILSWPLTASAFSLVSATNLGPAAAWTPVTNATVNNNGQVAATLSAPGGATFYRLISR
ncbi:MAG TPA: NPCBM/NEW2 domain-containing protein [Candidatus Acidoferrum sp.]|nr:NPCBM/NEW2 domain-containing protein [Candidatus Acidoferrum sp.]